LTKKKYTVIALVNIITPRFFNLKILAQNQSKQLNRMLHFFKIQL